MSPERAVLITGAAGFIGGYTADSFSKAGRQVIAIDLIDGRSLTHPARPRYDQYFKEDLAKESVTLALLHQYHPEVCIHLAGPASVEGSFQEPLKDFSAQTLPLLHLLEAVRKSKIPTRILLVSSAAVYGNPESLPVSEDARIQPISPYGFHKYYQEMLLDQYRVLYELRVCKARVFSTYGPGLTHLAVWDITNRAIKGEFSTFGSGEETRDYLYVEDVATALCHMSEKAPFAGEAINIASGREVRISELAKRIYFELGTDAEARSLKRHPDTGVPKRWCAEVSKLTQLGFVPQTSLEEGISKTVKWIGAQCSALAL